MSQGIQQVFQTGSVCLPSKDSGDDSFVPYESITEQTATQWLINALGDRVLEIEENLNKKMQQYETPTVKSGIPWGE